MRLYAITDRRLLTGEHVPGRLSAAEKKALLLLARGWAAAGVDWVQLREKDLPAEELIALAESMARVMQGNSTRLLLNGLGKGQIAGVVGVHLPGSWTRQQVDAAKRTGVVSVACHSVQQVLAASVAGADVALLSPIFPTPSHPEVVALGLEALREATRLAGSLPVYALGGVSATSAEVCVKSGAAGVAGIRMFLEGASAGGMASR